MQGKNCTAGFSFSVSLCRRQVVNFQLTSSGTNYDIRLAVFGLWFGPGQHYASTSFSLPSLLTAVC